MKKFLFFLVFFANTLFGQSDSLGRVISWQLPVDTVLIARLWTYDTTCAKVIPLPGHDWRAVTWRAAPLAENEGNFGEWTQGDTITIDTGIVLHATPAFKHRIFAHELAHQLLQMRNVIDSTSDPRVREAGDSIHPLVVFVIRCDFPGGIESPVPDILGEQDDAGASRGRIRPVPIFIPMFMQRPQQ